MRMDKLTSRFQQALADAQSLAVGRDSAYIEPQHLLLALLQQDDGGTSSLLARAGLKTVVIERASHAGGRCVTSEIAPGFFASPYADTIPAVTPALFPLLGLSVAGLEDFAPVGADIARRRLVH